MRSNLARAAEHFGVTVAGEPVFGWRLRSASAPANSPDGCHWLRVVSEQIQWAQGDWWTGNTDANTITGIHKPHVVDVVEWEIPEVRRQRAELMTYVPGRPCSGSDALRADVDLPSGWWSELRRSLDVIRVTPTARIRKDEPAIRKAVRDALGVSIELREWETVHGDLHWANLLQPEFGILDWELWGRGPVGTDAASLYCYSLLAPRTAATVWDAFADVLDTPTGTTALLYVAARLQHRVDMGDHPELAAPLRHLVDELAT
ncbi:aminoglycoside phosphotransferase [Saccharopolyspora elongata]|uniref:Aminoglycoside phosphotransferase n=2 Tax=Saccharopolyspora elongata TaxID=2530387 RepID=A0A4R4Z1U8_9PSEU|nr:aminoglycoside phosphotransferase [Saccharopolyspora elongata]